jgi:transposase-like protein
MPDSPNGRRPTLLAQRAAKIRARVERDYRQRVVHIVKPLCPHCGSDRFAVKSKKKTVRYCRCLNCAEKFLIREKEERAEG